MSEAERTVLLGPQALNASQVSVGVSLAEITLTLGSSRIVISPKTGAPEGEQIINWHSSFSLSPVVVKGMIVTLTEAVTAYEKEFGPVPAPPAASVHGAEAARRA
jgi:hypothetical protein